MSRSASHASSRPCPSAACRLLSARCLKCSSATAACWRASLRCCLPTARHAASPTRRDDATLALRPAVLPAPRHAAHLRGTSLLFQLRGSLNGLPTTPHTWHAASTPRRDDVPDNSSTKMKTLCSFWKVVTTRTTEGGQHSAKISCSNFTGPRWSSPNFHPVALDNQPQRQRNHVTIICVHVHTKLTRPQKLGASIGVDSPFMELSCFEWPRRSWTCRASSGP